MYNKDTFKDTLVYDISSYELIIKTFVTHLKWNSGEEKVNKNDQLNKI